MEQDFIVKWFDNKKVEAMDLVCSIYNHTHIESANRHLLDAIEKEANIIGLENVIYGAESQGGMVAQTSAYQIDQRFKGKKLGGFFVMISFLPCYMGTQPESLRTTPKLIINDDYDEMYPN
jgi:hypothetical protein